MSAIERVNNLPENVRRAMMLANMLEEAGPGELHAQTKMEAEEFIQLLASALVHSVRYSLDLIGDVQRENEPPTAQ